MQIVYNQFKDKEITYPDGVTGYIAGYTSTNLLLATKEKPFYSFRRMEKGFHYIDEKYKGEEYRYAYISERMVEEQHPTCSQKNL